MCTINCEDIKNCPICNHTAMRLYDDLNDNFFHVPNRWKLDQCTNCGLVYLNPRPTEEDAYKTYQQYYTHKTLKNGDQVRSNAIKRFIRHAVLSLLFLPHLFKKRQWRSLFIKQPDHTTLLDIGCGNGDFLDQMRKRGWNVTGIDVDPKSVDTARTYYGLEVHNGKLEDINFQDDSFDCITLNHVIEHVYDPVRLLIECRRILRSKGQIIIVTPNIRSLGHKWFKRNWRDLDPPRHLYLFSNTTLLQWAEQGGFKIQECWTTSVNAESIITGSMNIRKYGEVFVQNDKNIFRRIAILGVTWLDGVMNYILRNAGEELVMKLKK